MSQAQATSPPACWTRGRRLQQTPEAPRRIAAAAAMSEGTGARGARTARPARPAGSSWARPCRRRSRRCSGRHCPPGRAGRRPSPRTSTHGSPGPPRQSPCAPRRAVCAAVLEKTSWARVLLAVLASQIPLVACQARRSVASPQQRSLPPADPGNRAWRQAPIYASRRCGPARLAARPPPARAGAHGGRAGPRR
jgi:hypothetical protein